MDLLNLMPYFLLTVSLAFIAMSLFVFLKKKPLIFDSRWMLVIMMLCFFPQILMSVEMFSEDLSFMGILPIIMYVVLTVFYIFMMKGFMVNGMNETDFQKSFIECLNDKNYEYEQSLSSIKIKEPQVELSIAVQAWIGTAQIRFKGKSNRDFMNGLITDLKTKDIKANYIFSAFYLIIGILMMILSISLLLNPFSDF